MDSSTKMQDDLSVGDVFSPQADMTQSREETNMSAVKDTNFRMSECSPERKTTKQQAAINAFPAPKLNAIPLVGKSDRRKKKKRQQGNEVTSAISTVRGFTPRGSGDEDSDLSTSSSRAPSSKRHPMPTTNGNGGGVSALKLQLESLDISGDRPQNRAPSDVCSETPSNASVCSDSDQTEVLTSYEVPLDEDYVSTDAAAEENPQNTSGAQAVRSQLCRKMTADDFEPLLCLGKGSFGTVLLVRHVLTGKLYAQKQFRKASITVHKKLVEQTKTERTILESVNRHPFVVKLFYAFQDHEMLYLILEYAEGGELFTHLAMERKIGRVHV